MAGRKIGGLGGRFKREQESRKREAESQGLDAKLDHLHEEHRRLLAEREALERLREAPTPPVNDEVLLPIEALVLDGQAQPRGALDPQLIEDYTTRMISDAAGRLCDPEGTPWPPVEVCVEGDRYWVADGFHRVTAARRAGHPHIQCRVHPGGLREAIARSLGVNETHGKRRTREDKRRAVERALTDEQWRRWTNARIATMCRVSAPLVSRIRRELEERAQIPIEIALYAEDGGEWERKPEELQAIEAIRQRTSSGASHGRSSARTSSCCAPSVSVEQAQAQAQAQENPQRAWDALDTLTPDTRPVVAYPEQAEDYLALITWLQRAEARPRRVILPSHSGSAWLWRGPALLEPLVDELGYEQPQLIYLENIQKSFCVWARDGEELPSRWPTPEAARVGGEPPQLIGVALERW